MGEATGAETLFWSVSDRMECIGKLIRNGEEFWNCRSVSVRLYPRISTAISGSNQEI